jgi:hypothetical protein
MLSMLFNVNFKFSSKRPQASQGPYILNSVNTTAKENMRRKIVSKMEYKSKFQTRSLLFLFCLVTDLYKRCIQYISV